MIRPTMNLYDKLNTVTDEKSFLDFLKALENDWHENTEEWENTTIPAFLESAVSWAEDMGDENEHFKKPKNPWKLAAQILYAGKLYE